MAKKKNVVVEPVVEQPVATKEPKVVETKIKVTQGVEEGRAPFTTIAGPGVTIECEQGYVQVIDGNGVVHLAKEVNKELVKITEGKVGVSDKGTFVLNGVDTDELKEKIWY